MSALTEARDTRDIAAGGKVISDFYSKEHVKNIWREYYPRILEKWAPKKKIRKAK